MERIVVGVDGSEAGRGALRWALDEGVLGEFGFRPIPLVKRSQTADHAI